jgi:hypothetical protein
MGRDKLPIRLYVDIIAALLQEPKMPKFVDRAGFRYGRLTVKVRAGTTANKKVLWECLCDCGNITFTDSCSLITGNTLSCGCYLKEKITKHSGSGRGSYNTWRAMIRRCTKPHDKDYPRYGGVGVSVCPEWLDYSVFVADMGEPDGDETLDRINTYGNYTRENCRWAGVKTQNRNTRLRANSKTGVIGVSITNNKFMAKIAVGKKSYYSKVYKTVEEAAAARKELERKYW